MHLLTLVAALLLPATPVSPGQDAAPTAVADRGARPELLWDELQPPLGPHAVGFTLSEPRDRTRPALVGDPGGDAAGRRVRVYTWYPARAGRDEHLKLRDYVRMAADDFRQPDESTSTAAGTPELPVPLAEGFEPAERARLLTLATAAVRDAVPLDGPFPLVVVGQGLYYESPLSLALLCEHLASHGYVVATCPLQGTRVRLVQRDVVDLECEARDLELVLAVAGARAQVDRERTAVVGYDLGGMAGLLVVMRHPEIDALLTLDSGILQPHFLGIPQAHPGYDESSFTVPWMHITQARFVPEPGDRSSLAERKPCGDTYVLGLASEIHGAFTSYAALGLHRAVQGYWGETSEDTRLHHETVCRCARTFLDAYLKGSTAARELLQAEPQELASRESLQVFRRREGQPRPPSRAELLQRLIVEGPAAIASIEELVAAHPDLVLVEEDELTWLGYHFLYWWGRRDQAAAVFELATRLFPQSADAWSSLAEALLVTGDEGGARRASSKALELDPADERARAILARLGESR